MQFDSRKFDESMKREQDEAIAKFLRGEVLNTTDLSCAVDSLEDAIRILAMVVDSSGGQDSWIFVRKLLEDAKKVSN